MTALRRLFRSPLYWLLAFAPVTLALEVTGAAPIWILVAASLAIIPFAGLIGESTEALAAHTGPRIGGLLNATLGNAAELIITIVAIREGLLELVKASITGSIIGNLLFVLGLSMVWGGLRHGVQTFVRQRAMTDSIQLLLAVTALAVPSLFVHSAEGINGVFQVEALSLGVAALMVAIYALGLFFSLRGGEGPLTRPSAEPVVHTPAWGVRGAMIVLTFATAGVVWLSESLVQQVEPVVLGLGISEFFLGVILVPIVGNIAEHLVAVRVAAQNRMSLSVEIAVGSSLQIALFVVPVLVFVSLVMGHPLTLVFNNFELVALIGAVVILVQVASDGESNWLEGAELLALYLILALAFFLLP